ncbi:hypothetical protein B0T25DRAFT_466550 [Lasiosphaeria hispida]|uniref:Zn(2)-C6 fungal-type domain-containing protein n=1 Tax=Lasiosphaeria hispida TaxID=260671 RepID=A0AAJ0H574_9PEZI|nr:hypothetical protein B0T25DRAFT_466550 [Lasiosphaeria hispida]
MQANDEDRPPPSKRTRIRKRKACLPCTKSKRKCDKSSPLCMRCLERGMACEYQPLPFPVPPHPDTSSTRACVAPDEDEAEEVVDRGVFGPSAGFSGHSNLNPHPQPDDNSNGSTFNFTTCTDDGPGPDPLLSQPWFLSPDSWENQRMQRQIRYEYPICQETSPRFIAKLQTWTDEWARAGHSPVMHRHLYGDVMPECIQDAFTTRIAYRAATPATKPSIVRIINDRANRLVHSHFDPSAMNTTNTATVGSTPTLTTPSLILDTPTHLTRVQALFLHQLTRLFDGDIRARADAENHMDTLNSWSAQMLESARLDCAAAELVMPTAGSPDADGANCGYFGLGLGRGGAPADPPALWRAWILAESVRRVYLMVRFMQAVYLVLKQGWCTCPGGAAFTARAGLWDAPSAWAWYKVAKGGFAGGEAGGGANGSEDTGGSSTAPCDIDDFAYAVMEINYGLDLMEKWVTQHREGVSV